MNARLIDWPQQEWTQLCSKITKLTTKIHNLEGETIKMLVTRVRALGRSLGWQSG